MKRLLALVALGAVTVGATACDASPPAATADGFTVSRSQLDAVLTSITDSPVAQCALQIQATAGGATQPTMSGVGDHTVTTRFADDQLGVLIQQAIETQALARHHAHITSADLVIGRQDYEAQLQQAASQVGSPCNLTGPTLTNRLPRSFLDEQAMSTAAQERVEEVVDHVDVRPAALRAYYASHLDSATQQCLDFIVTANQTDAQAIHDQIAGGSSFLAASQGPQVVQGTPAGGQGPCVYPSTVTSQLGAPVEQVLATLPVGTLAPVQQVQVTNQVTGAATTYWLVLEVRQRQLVPFDALQGAIRRLLLSDAGSSLGHTLTGLVHRAQVDVDPQYGSWNASGGLSGPRVPSPGSLLNTKVDAAASGGSILGGSGG